MKKSYPFAVFIVALAVLPTSAGAHSVSPSEPVRASFTDGVDEMVRSIVRDPEVDTHRAKARRGVDESRGVLRAVVVSDALAKRSTSSEAYLSSLKETDARIVSVSASSTEVRIVIAYTAKAFRITHRTVVFTVSATPSRTTVSYSRRSALGTDASSVASNLERATEKAGLQSGRTDWNEEERIRVIHTLLDAIPVR